MATLNNTPADESSELAATLITAIIPLQKYLLTESAQNNVNTLWKFTIGELKQQLTALTERINDTF